MAITKILLVGAEIKDFKHLENLLADGFLLDEVNDIQDCIVHQRQSDAQYLTIIDSKLIKNGTNLVSLANDLAGKIIIIGQNWPEKMQIEAIASGVSGYCDKDISSELFYRVIGSVLSGEVWVPRHLIPKVIGLLIEKNIVPGSLVEDSGRHPEKTEILNLLSNRELQVATMIANGCTNKKIASTLYITERTVKAHLTNIFKKMNLPDRIHLAIFMKGVSVE